MPFSVCNRRNYCLTQTTPNVTNDGPMDPSDVGKSISCLFSGASLVLIFRLQELWKHVRGHSSKTKTRKIQEIFAIEKPERLRQWMTHGKLQTVDPGIARIFPGFPKFSVPLWRHGCIKNIIFPIKMARQPGVSPQIQHLQSSTSTPREPRVTRQGCPRSKLSKFCAVVCVENASGCW